MKVIRRRQEGEQGASLIEFVIVAPVLLMLFLAVVDFGFFLNHYLVLTRAVHEGVMLGARMPGLTATVGEIEVEDETEIEFYTHYLIQERVRRSAQVYQDNGELHAIDLDESSFYSQFPSPDPAINNAIKVRFSSPYQSLFGMELNFNVEAIGPYVY